LNSFTGRELIATSKRWISGTTAGSDSSPALMRAAWSIRSTSSVDASFHMTT